jgi:hypothetical protein
MTFSNAICNTRDVTITFGKFIEKEYDDYTKKEFIIIPTSRWLW